MRSMPVDRISEVRAGIDFVTHLARFSRKLRSHSNAKPLMPASESRFFARLAINLAGSDVCARCALKKSGCCEATSIIACTHPWSISSLPCCAISCITCTRMPSVCASGAHCCGSDQLTVTQTSCNAAAFSFSSGFVRASCNICPSSCMEATTSACSVGTKSMSKFMDATHLSTEDAAEAFAMRYASCSSPGQPQGWPGARLPRGSSLSHTYSASLEITSPIFFCIGGDASASNSRRSSLANCCWFAGGSFGQMKSFWRSFMVNCRSRTAQCARTAVSTSPAPRTDIMPTMSWSGWFCLAC
mmetsp:Transcript_66958/g.181083  ORF Transcript_66958/g.181083 Transcript_66958/m.181083 type:complete len:301 (+) Transcript_66958:2426-3328(+)